MAIIVEDGSIVENANSYVTEAELLDYASARGIALIASAEQLLTQSMDYIESQSFKGSKYTQDQELQWPREGVTIDGFEVSVTTIPKQLKQAQMANAVAVDSGLNPLRAVEPGIKREKIDDAVDVEYQDNAISQSYDAATDAFLKKLITSGGSSFILRAYR